MFLAYKESKNNNKYTNPLNQWQLFAKYTKHQQSCKHRTDIIEYISRNNAYATNTVAEQDKGSNTAENA